MHGRPRSCESLSLTTCTSDILGDHASSPVWTLLKNFEYSIFGCNYSFIRPYAHAPTTLRTFFHHINTRSIPLIASAHIRTLLQRKRMASSKQQSFLQAISRGVSPFWFRASIIAPCANSF